MKKLYFLFLLVSFAKLNAQITVVITPPVGTPPFCTNIPYAFSGSGSPGPIILWQWNCSPSAGANIQNANQNATNITFTTIGTYTLTLIVVDNSGRADSGKYTLTVTACSSNISVYGQQENFKIYPNPSNGEIFLSSMQESGHLIIYDVLGNKVFESTLEKGSIKINSLESGVYHAIYISGNGILTKKIIISD